MLSLPQQQTLRQQGVLNHLANHFYNKKKHSNLDVIMKNAIFIPDRFQGYIRVLV